MKAVIIIAVIVIFVAVSGGCGNGNIVQDMGDDCHWVDVEVPGAEAEYHKRINLNPVEELLWTSYEEKSAEIEAELSRLESEYDVVFMRLQYTDNGYLIDATVRYAEKGSLEKGGVRLEMIRGESRWEILDRIEEAERTLEIIKIQKIDNGEKLSGALVFYRGEEEV